MTDGQWLFILFVALYLMECLRWLPGGAWLLAGAAEGWWFRRPLQQVEVAGRKPVLLPVLPPLRAHVVVFPWLLVPGEEGLEFYPDEAGQPVLIPWGELAVRTELGTLHLTRDLRLHLPTEAAAAEWMERLKSWAELKPGTREKAFLKFAQQTLDVKALSQEAGETARRTRVLRWVGSLTFLWCFGTVSILYRWLGESPEVMAAAAFLVLLLWTQTVLFWRAAGRFTTPVKHRFWKSLAVALLPQHAMRAGDLLCRVLSTGAHPLAARELVGDKAWMKLARQFWKATRHGLGVTAGLQTRALEAFFQEQGVKPEDLEEKPERQAGSAAYCPKCQAQFTNVNAVCKDCGGLALRGFEETSGGEVKEPALEKAG